MQEYLTPLPISLDNGAHIDLRLRLACDLMKAHAVVAAQPDGEDSAGRQKLKLLSPADVVKRAFAMADLAISEGETRGWIKPVSDTYAEVVAMRFQAERDAMKKSRD